MEDNYSKRAMEFIRNNFEKIVNKEDYLSISVGGSVARGYARNHSDIDFLCITKKEKQYKKIFKTIEEFPVEIHVIPESYIYALMQSITEYSNIEYGIPQTNSEFSMGAKKCMLIERKLDKILKLFSDWREIKKVSDSIIIYEDESKFLSKFEAKIENAAFYKKAYEDFEENLSQYSNVDKIINIMKIYSIYLGKVFSKVLWTDIYLNNDYISKVTNMIRENILIDKENELAFYNWTERNYEKIIEEHSKINCDFCKEDYLQCNIMRCIHDYINDTKKAKENGLELGEVLSIKKSIEYISLLYKKLNIKDNELEQINDKIKISDEVADKLWTIVKEECKKNACD